MVFDLKMVRHERDEDFEMVGNKIKVFAYQISILNFSVKD